jgi:hypothetical protein
LELNVSNLDIPDNISIINEDKQATEVVILDKKVVFKQYHRTQKSIFTKLWRMTKVVEIE